jgi:hypothetical protein
MTRQPVHHVVEERTSGYITRAELESFLQARYPSVASIDEFDIKVCPQLPRQNETHIAESVRKNTASGNSMRRMKFLRYEQAYPTSTPDSTDSVIHAGRSPVSRSIRLQY